MRFEINRFKIQQEKQFRIITMLASLKAVESSFLVFKVSFVKTTEEPFLQSLTH